MAVLCRLYPLTGLPQDIVVNVRSREARRDAISVSQDAEMDSRTCFTWREEYREGEVDLSVCVFYCAPTDLPDNPLASWLPGNFVMYVTAGYETVDEERERIFVDYSMLLDALQADALVQRWSHSMEAQHAELLTLSRGQVTPAALERSQERLGGVRQGFLDVVRTVVPAVRHRIYDLAYNAPPGV